MELEAVEAMKLRTTSQPDSNPITGADLGSGLVQGRDSE